MDKDKEKLDLEAFPTSKSALKMLSYVTQGFYDKSYVGKWLYQVMGQEYDKALKLAEELKYQMFPETATWGLMYHEMKWQLPIRENLSYEERRKLIYQKRDCRSPMTPYRMEQYLENITGFRVHIADINDLGEYGLKSLHPNFFIVYSIEQETIDTKQIRQILDKIKQSHTDYTINQRIFLEVKNILQFYLHCINNKFQCAKCDNSISVSGSVYFTIEEKTEKVGVVTLEKCENLWYLDGNVLLDGSRTLNASYEMEEL